MEILWTAARFKNRSQYLLAAGVQNQTFNRYEYEHGIPDEIVLAKLAAPLGVTVADLQTSHRESRRLAGIAEGTSFATPAIATRLANQRPSQMNDDDVDNVRAQAVLNLVKDPALDVQREEIGILEDIVSGLAAYKGLPELQKRLRLAFLGYRSDPGSYGHVPGVTSAFSYGPARTEAGEAETRAAQQRNEEKGHMPLKRRPPPNG